MTGLKFAQSSPSLTQEETHVVFLNVQHRNVALAVEPTEIDFNFTTATLLRKCNVNAETGKFSLFIRAMYFDSISHGIHLQSCAGKPNQAFLCGTTLPQQICSCPRS